MMRAMMRLLLGCLLCGALGAQNTRLVIVRDDDGTAEEGRGQVSSQNSVCRKTLVLEQPPEAVRRAWVQYFMKVQPYDTRTKKLYHAPAEGVEWSDLVVTVNGTEILRDSLIEHGGIGWHEAEFDPALLKAGENQVTLTLGEPGSYFYLGIDRDSDLGRSASSRDAGKTWRESWLSFTTEEPDGGEYMVRLKLESPAPERVGFVERNGLSYGWIELEDLFSKTVAHRSGFKAIEWTKGVNQPSDDWLAWGPEGRFSFPLEIPLDRQWRLWLRAWVDGFRGGRFTLAVGGKPIYDSAAHEFTSDNELRLDWLDLGQVHLGEGRHTFEIRTFGDCGHMFDALALTTDQGYDPRTAEPLARMTVDSLVTAPEVELLEPGLYLTEHPIPWATPLAGGPLRTLWVCGDINEREAVELQRRLDLEARAISSPTGYFGNNVFGQDLALEQADALYGQLTAAAAPDVILLIRTKLDQIPAPILTALLARVEAGAGLIVVRSKRDEQPTALGELLGDLRPMDVSALPSQLDLSNLNQAAWREYGQGRIVVLPYALWGTLNRLAVPPHELRYAYWEDQFARWSQFVLTAADRERARVVELSLPATVAPGAAPAVAVRVDGAAAAVRAIWRAPFSEPVALAPAPVRDGRAELAVPAASEDGLYHLALTLMDSDGGAVGIASGQYEVQQPVRLTSLSSTCDGAAVTATADLTGAARVTVEAEVYGAHHRLLGRATGAVGANAELRLPLLPSPERLVELRLTVAGNDGPAQRLRQLVPRPQPVVLDDYLPYTGLWTNREAPDYTLPAYAWIYAQLGFQAVQPSGVIWSSLEQGFATALPYSLTKLGNATIEATGARQPCLHDEAVWAKEEPAIQESVKRQRVFSPVLLGLGDEMSIGHQEACFDPQTFTAFRPWLQQRYATIAALNDAWETNFGGWAEVMPWRIDEARQRPDNLAPWLEFRRFMADTFVGSIQRMQTVATAAAGDTHVGGVNPWDEGWTTCTVMSKLFPILGYGQIYPRSHDRARSWFRDPRLVGTWSGYNRPEAQVEREGWLLPAYGGTFMGWYGVGRELGYETLTGTLNLGDRARWIQRVNQELTAGIGKLLIELEQVPEPVAILHSWPSRCAFIALRGAADPKATPDGLDQTWHESEETLVRLLRDLKVPYRFVDEDQVAAGELANYRLLIAPRAWALPAATVAAVAGYAEDHPVILDAGFGGWDERGVRRAEPPTVPGATLWDDLPAPLTEKGRERLREVLSAAGIAPNELGLEGDVSFVVHRKLGNRSLAVVFGQGPLTITAPPAGPGWDLRAHRPLGAPAVTEMAHGPAVIAFGPATTGLTLTAPAVLRRGGTADIQVALPGAETVVRVEVSGPDRQSRPWNAANTRLAGGVGTAAFTPALNDPPGTWTIRAVDLITGETAVATVEVR